MSFFYFSGDIDEKCIGDPGIEAIYVGCRCCEKANEKVVFWPRMLSRRQEQRKFRF